MLRPDDGVLQVIVRDGKVMVIAKRQGGGELVFPDDDADFTFQVDMLMMGMEYVLRMNGATPQALDFAEHDERERRISERLSERLQQLHEPFPTPPVGL